MPVSQRVSCPCCGANLSSGGIGFSVSAVESGYATLTDIRGALTICVEETQDSEWTETPVWTCEECGGELQSSELAYEEEAEEETIPDSAEPPCPVPVEPEATYRGDRGVLAPRSDRARQGLGNEPVRCKCERIYYREDMDNGVAYCPCGESIKSDNN